MLGKAIKYHNRISYFRFFFLACFLLNNEEVGIIIFGHCDKKKNLEIIELKDI